MYGLPDDIDLSFLRGRKLDSVCIGLYQVRLVFKPGNVKIDSFGVFKHRRADGVMVEVKVEVEVGKVPTSGILLSLLGSDVVQVDWNPDGTLNLTFTNGEVVTFIDDTSGYESYWINSPDGQIVV
jgi:hypothetical protein